jgi:hypothetical protein
LVETKNIQTCFRILIGDWVSSIDEKTRDVNVPDVEASYCLGSEGNGVSVEEGGEGLARPSRKGEKISVNAQQKHGQHGEG